MPVSPVFAKLQERLSILKKRFLSIPQDASGQYSDDAKDFARSYRVLVHAEIEAYIRFRVDETIRHVLKLWRERGINHHVLVSMLACWNKNWSDESDVIPLPKKDLRDGGRAVTINALIDRAFKAYQDNIKTIYGIRPVNLSEILLPLGIDINTEEFGATWRADMENFAIQRGRVAHGGVDDSLDISPDDERRRIDGILPGIEILDRKFSELL